MGSTSSIMLSKQPTLQLSAQSLEEFNNYRLDCVKNSTQSTLPTIYNKLTCKYEQLLEKEYHLKSIQYNNDINNDEKDVDTSLVDENNSSNHDHLVKNERFILLKEISGKILEIEDELIVPEETDNNYLRNIMDDLFLMNNKKDNQKINSIDDKKELNTEIYFCDLCLISFDSKYVLEYHNRSSSLHIKNKRRLEEKRLEMEHELERLHSVADDVACIIHGHTNDNKISTTFSKSKILWDKAKNFVIGKQLIEKFTERLNTRMDLPWGIQLIFSSIKYFHKNNQTYDIQYYLHTTYDILEIVPHLIPISHIEEKLIDTSIESFISCDHIYLCYSDLIKSFFHYNDLISPLTSSLNSLHDKRDDILQLHMSKSFKFAEHRAIGVYITSHLKVHKAKTTVCSTYLYLCIPGVTIQSNPSTPIQDGFKSLVIDKSIIKNAWILKYGFRN